MKTMGFLISHKNGEQRRALLPENVAEINHPEMMLLETGYGESIGVSDEEYAAMGCRIVSREEALACDIIADVKLGDADYLDEITDSKIMFGWAHTVQNIDFTSDMLNKNHTVVAWEEIFENGRYIFWRNREVAGEAGILHALRYARKMPYDASVAVIGNGQVARGVMRILHGLGTKRLEVFDYYQEDLFRSTMTEFDIIVNCVFWDTSRTDRLIYKEDLKKFKPGTLIVDISCDPELEIETSHPTTIEDPVYTVDGVVHYAVDNTPAMFPITVTRELGKGITDYINILIEEDDYENYPDNLKTATVINKGHIQDERIRAFREARGIFCK